MKFNLMNYVLESGTMLLFGLVRNEYISILYFVVNCCGTPLVYYIGMEENRRQAQDYFRLLLFLRNIVSKCFPSLQVPYPRVQKLSSDPNTDRGFADTTIGQSRQKWSQ